MRIHDENRWTILHKVLEENKNLKQWLRLLERKCSNPNDVKKLFKMKDRRSLTLLDYLKDKCQNSIEKEEIKEQLSFFFDKTNLVELKNELLGIRQGPFTWMKTLIGSNK